MPKWKPKRKGWGAGHMSNARNPKGFGVGQDTPDSLWDKYQSREVAGAMGAGGEGGMGAGGVYVQAPDGSLHWDETKADPNDAGGSVISATTGQVIPGANRQSGPSGPGGTGPPGSQARALHVSELIANPSFRSTGGGSIFDSPLGPMMAGSTMSAVTQPGALSTPGAVSQAMGSPQGILGTASSRNPNTNYTPWIDQSKVGKLHATAGELDPTGYKTYYGGGGNELGAGAQGGMGAGDVAAPDPNELAYDNAYLQIQKQIEDDANQKNMAQLQQDWAIHQDDVALSQATEAELHRHQVATEQLTARQQDLDAQINQLDNQSKLQVQQMQSQSAQQIEQMREASAVQLAQMQEGTSIYLQQGQQAFQDWQARQTDLMSILSSALGNPWMQQLTGMAPQGGAGTPTGGANIAALVKQALTPYDTSQFGQQNAPSSMNLTGPAQGPTPPPLPGMPTAQQAVMSPANLTWDQLSNQLRQAAGGNYNDAAAKQLAQSLSGQTSGNVSLNLSPDQINQIVQAGSNKTINSYAGLSQPQQQAAPAPAPAPAPAAQSAGTQMAAPAAPAAPSAPAPTVLDPTKAAPATNQTPDFSAKPPGTGQDNPYESSTAGGAGIYIPTWQQWQSWSPYQKAAYRANIEALGPGVWNQVQQSLQTAFTQQGGSANVTQLAGQSADTEGQIGQQMTAQAFGQTTPQWQQAQQKQWSKAAAPSVRQNLGVSGGGGMPAASSPESQYGV